MPTQGFKGRLKVNGNSVGVAKDVTLNIETDEVDVTARQNDALKAFLPGQDDVSIDFTLGNEPTDARWIEIQQAFANKTALTNVRVTDKITSEHYVQLSEAYVFGFGKEGAMDAEQVWSGTMRPGPNAVMTFAFA